MSDVEIEEPDKLHMADGNQIPPSEEEVTQDEEPVEEL